MKHRPPMPQCVLVLGSGGLKIGQAGEFDYSGSQAIKALKEEGVRTVLINPNIATVQTDEQLADAVYFVPVEPKEVERVIAKEKPDGLLLSFGGQTALNCGTALYTSGVLSRYGVRVLGTPVSAIADTEDRERFVKRLKELGVHTPVSRATTSIAEAQEAAQAIGYPVMVRVAYALGGRGSGVCHNKAMLTKRAEEAFSVSSQLLVEEWLGGWKEIEYEVVRDVADNCITVCNMENFDPLGIHTGESIVVAPSQTLTNSEYHTLREVALKVVRHLGIVGECNIQYALDPKSGDYRVIEVNARLSRSSALASKATGYPLAFVAAKLALGYTLPELPNKVTGTTTACFEPSLDYVVVKVPRWDLKKFRRVSTRLGSEMKSVGEVMAIGRSFEEALQKALRMTECGYQGLEPSSFPVATLRTHLAHPTDKRIFAVAQALHEGMTIDAIHRLTRIDRWFLAACDRVVKTAETLKTKPLQKALLLRAKRDGFSDAYIGTCAKKSEAQVRALRLRHGIVPVVKQIDTLAAEYPARTNYLYLTYHGVAHDVEPSKHGVLLLGSGPYRIGSSVEFDWCCVNATHTARKMGHTTLMLNCNPETVSTDYDICDRLYFEELSLERVLDVTTFENPHGVIVSMGGQVPNNLAQPLSKSGVRILGTDPKNIDRAENRYKFSALLDTLGILQPRWGEFTSVPQAATFACTVGFPVLIRPSYVLSGAAMNVAWNEADLVTYLRAAVTVNPHFPVVITKFVQNAKEIEVDAVAQNGSILFYAIAEHVENAGVHSGDATLVLPSQRLYTETVRQVKRATRELAAALEITGPFNAQFLAYRNKVEVIECNLRASRSFPFSSKVLRVNLAALATSAMLTKKQIPRVPFVMPDYVGVKAAQFSFSRLKGTDPILGVEMASTGEVGCLGNTPSEALLTAMGAVGFVVPKAGVYFSSRSLVDWVDFLDCARKIRTLGIPLYAPPKVAAFFEEYHVDAFALPFTDGERTVYDAIRTRKVDLVISIPQSGGQRESLHDYRVRRTAADLELSLITNIQLAKELVNALALEHGRIPSVKSWQEYGQGSEG